MPPSNWMGCGISFSKGMARMVVITGWPIMVGATTEAGKWPNA